MSYPKPLSEKSLKRLYTQAGLSTEACDFLHSLFAACANLYGAIALRDVWSVYAEEKSLVDFIGNLESTAAECAPRQHKTYPNENRGKKLRAFSFLNLSERFDLEYYKKVPATYSALLEEYSGTEAEKIMRQHRWDENIGRLHTTEIIQNLENELHEVGVRLTEKQQDTLMRLIVQYHNGSRLWCLRGWKPNELADMHGNSDVPSI